MAISDLSVVMPTGSGMSSGQPTSLSSAFTTLHTPATGIHQVYMWATNPNTSSADISLRYSGPTNTTTEVISIAAKTKQLVIDGSRINTAITLQASASGSPIASFRITRVD